MEEMRTKTKKTLMIEYKYENNIAELFFLIVYDPLISDVLNQESGTSISQFLSSGF